MNQRKDSQRNDNISILQLITKLIFPITIITLALIFKSSFESLIPRTSKAELLGSKLEFVSSEIGKEYIHQELERILGEGNIPPEIRENIKKIKDSSNTLFGISPISLYYLIGSVGCETLNYDLLQQEEKSSELKEIQKLETAGLAILTVEKNEAGHEDLFGTRGLVIRPTKAGILFLQAIGVKVKTCD